VSFKLPHEKRALGAIMRIMEELKGDPVVDEQEVGVAIGGSAAQEDVRRKVLQDYTINGPTLEEVFMNVARESGVSGAGGV
jgi:ATP-binding cassette subfamily A (ABC1) protein 3